MAEYVARACTCHRGYNAEPKTKENTCVRVFLAMILNLRK